MSLKFLSIPTKTLSQSITSSSSSFKLNNIKSWAKNSLGVNINLVAGDFGTQAFGVFRNDTGTTIEIFEFDPATIASASITITRRGLKFDGDQTTETSTYKLDWPAGTQVLLGTDAPQLFQYLKEYIDTAVIGGGVPATTTTAGIVELATDAETTTGTDTARAITPANLAAGIAAALNDLIIIETTAGATHSLTTIASQKVIVWAKGNINQTGGIQTVNLKYNSVTKDTSSIFQGNTNEPASFSLMYTEVPGAATANITVDGVTVENVVIIVLKVKAALL